MSKSSFPKQVVIKDSQYNFRLMNSKDRKIIMTLAKELSENDLLFMRRDITQPETIDQWLQEIEEQRALSILVEEDNRVIGYGTLYYNQMFWSRHLGEIRFLVSSPYRNRGIASRLTRELMKLAVELELEKVFSYMAADDKGAQKIVEELGFQPEAVLAEWVKTRDERTHDLLIMSTGLGNLQN